MENNNLNCSICLEDLNDKNFVFDEIFECIHSHNVCSNCLNKIDKCPLCRAKKKPVKNNYSKLTIYDKYDILIGIEEFTPPHKDAIKKTLETRSGRIYMISDADGQAISIAKKDEYSTKI